MGDLKDKIELINDIQEADDILYNSDRQKAIDFIRKQSLKNTEIGLFNSPLNTQYITFDKATPQQILNHVAILRDYLITKKIGMEE